MPDNRGYPYLRWKGMHKGRARKCNKGNFKISHRFWIVAQWHKISVTKKFNKKYNVYSCRWHNDFRLGETAKRHWHVGTDDKYGRVNSGTARL